MKSKLFTSLAAGLVIAAVGASRAAAQNPCTFNGAYVAGTNCTVTDNVTATVNLILSLQLSSTATDLGTPLPSEFDVATGHTSATAQTVTAKGNKAYTVTISAGSATFTTAPATVTKNTSDIGFSLTGAAPFTALSTSPTAGNVLASGKGSRTATVTYNTLWNSSNDAPGNYVAPVVYTITAP